MILVGVSKDIRCLCLYSSWGCPPALWDPLTIRYEWELGHLAHMYRFEFKCLSLELNLMSCVIPHFWATQEVDVHGKDIYPLSIFSVLPQILLPLTAGIIKYCHKPMIWTTSVEMPALANLLPRETLRELSVLQGCLCPAMATTADSSQLTQCCWEDGWKPNTVTCRLCWAWFSHEWQLFFSLVSSPSTKVENYTSESHPLNVWLGIFITFLF